MKLRKEALAVFGIAAALIASLLIVVDSRQQTAGAAAGYSMAVDAISSGNSDVTVNNTRTVTGVAPFRVGIQITGSLQVYSLYQWEIQFLTGGLAFVGNTVENTAAPPNGTGLALCASPTDNTLNANPPIGQTVIGAGAGCTDNPPALLFIGTTSTFDMQCVTDGVFSLLLVNLSQDSAFGSDIQTGVGATQQPTTGVAATITCTNTGAAATATFTATNTPTVTRTPANTATSTPTCVPAFCPTATNTPTGTATFPPVYTRTPTPTPTGSATVAAAPTQSTGSIPPPSGGGAPAANGGGARSGIRLPDTGSGANGSAGGNVWWMLIGIIGGGLAVAGASTMILRKRTA